MQSPASSDSRPEKRARIDANCAECRRLKVKCDRNVPCAGCTRRGYPDLCPENTLENGLKGLLAERRDLLAKVEQLEQDAAAARLRPGLNAGMQGAPIDVSSFDDPSSGPTHPPYIAAAGGTQYDAAAVFADFHRPQQSQQSQRPMPAIQEASSPVESPHHVKGTLVQETGGEYRFIGPAAGAPFHMASTGGPSHEAPLSRSQSTSRETSPDCSTYHIPGSRSVLRDPPEIAQAIGPGFPLLSDTTGGASSNLQEKYTELQRFLLENDDAEVHVAAYFRHVAWIGTPILRKDFDAILDRHKRSEDGLPGEATSGRGAGRHCAALQELALIYAVMALGTAANMEVPPLHRSSRKLFDLAQKCLTAGRFLTVNTMAALQALALMAKYVAYSSLTRRWDLAWQLWGLATRVMLAMGLHRDGQNWDLAEQDLEQRRMVFWEIYSTEIFMSINWNRPNAIASGQTDTQYPTSWRHSVITYSALRADLAQLCKEALDISLRVTPPVSYAEIRSLWEKFLAFEASIPYHLRCQAAIIAKQRLRQTSTTPTRNHSSSDPHVTLSSPSNPGVPSRSMQADVAPHPSKGDMRTTFQQHHIVLNLSVAIANLLRPYFAASVKECSENPRQAEFGEAFEAVCERCSMLIAMISSLYKLHPLPSVRHWFFWSLCISAAATLAVVCIACPTCPESTRALRDLDSMLSLLPAVKQSLPQGDVRSDTRWLTRLRDQASAAIERAAHKVGRKGANEAVSYPSVSFGIPADSSGFELVDAQSHANAMQGSSLEGGDAVVSGKSPAESGLDAIGWRTKLIRRESRRRAKDQSEASPSEIAGRDTTVRHDIVPQISESDQINFRTERPIPTDFHDIAPAFLGTTSHGQHQQQQQMWDTNNAQFGQQDTNQPIEGFNNEWIQRMLAYPMGQPMFGAAAPAVSTGDEPDIWSSLFNPDMFEPFS